MAVFTVAAGRDGTTELLAALLVAQMAPSALTGALAGGLVDRVPRRTLMLGADAARAAAVASLLIAPHPSAVHFLGVAVMLGACGALFAPSVQAAIPGLVSDADLVRANAVLATTQNATIVLAPLAGGFIVAQLGASTAFALNGLSFVASAILVAYAGLPRSAASAAEVARSPIPVRGRAPASVVARGFAAAGAVLMVGAAIKTPVEPALVLDVLAERAEVLGVVTAVWGVGMIAGSSGAHALARLVPLDRLFAGAVTLVGACVLAGALAPGVLLLLALWLAAGFGNGVGGVVFDTLLQRHSPEAIRGRIAAITEAAMDFGYLAGAAAAAALATMTGPRGCLVASGVLFLASAGAWRLASASIRPLAATSPEPPDEPAPRGALAPVHP
jgi:MFS family permease